MLRKLVDYCENVAITTIYFWSLSNNVYRITLERFIVVNWLHQCAVVLLRLVTISRKAFFTPVLNVSCHAILVKTLLELVFSFLNSKVSGSCGAMRELQKFLSSAM